MQEARTLPIDEAPATRGAVDVPALPPSLPRRNHRPRPKHLLVLADLGAVAVAVALATVLVPVTEAGTPTRASDLIVGLAPFIWLVALGHQSLYNARRLGRRIEEFKRILSAAAWATAAMVVVAFVLDAPVSRGWLTLLPTGAVVLLTVEREIARRAFVRLRRSGRVKRPVVVVGVNQEATDLAAMMDADPSVGYEVVGFVTDLSIERVADHIRPRVLGVVADTAEVVKNKGAIGVVIASTAVTTPVSNRLARTLTDAGVHVEISSTLRDIAVERLTVASIGAFPTVYVEATRRDGWRAVAKRCFDIVVSACFLVVAAPTFAVIAVLVRLTSPGPVFFRQERMGKAGKPFEVVKFRTMVRDAEKLRADLDHLNEADGPLFKMADDPRVTEVGRILRKSSLDEIPQFWNVLRGEMSLVGPRPALSDEAENWPPELRERLRVKPGITGAWQVNGRSSSSFDDYTRLDLYYVDNWSLVNDLSIMARTLPAVLFRRGAC